MTEPQLCNCACHNGVALVHFAPCCSLCQRCGAMVPHGVAHACRVQMTKESIKVIFVALEVDGMPSLGILLGDDGHVNRLGSGTVDNTDRGFFIGRADTPLFAQLRDKVQPEWLSHPGAYDVPEKAGRTCELIIILKASEGPEFVSRFRYGSESQGPPAEICQFVAEAVRLTDSWYEDQKHMAGLLKKAKPWWKIW